MTRRLPPGVTGPRVDPRYPDNAPYYQAALELPRGPDGKRRRRVVQAATPRECADKLAALRRQIDDGTLPVGPGTTTGQWLDHWLSTIAGPGLRPRSRENYAWAVERARPHVGGVPLDKLAPEHLEACYAALLKDGLSATSVGDVHRRLHAALQVAEDRRRISRSPASLVRPPRVPHKTGVSLEGDEVPKVLAAAAASHDGARWLFALAMGSRSGETLGLTWDRLDLDAAVPTVDLSLQLLRHERAWHLVDVKSAAGRRRLRVPVELVPMLKAHRQQQVERRLALGAAWVGSDLGDLVFPTATGAPKHRAVDRKAWLKVLDAAGVRRIRVHDARHTNATLMLEQGVPVLAVAAWLGHSSPNMSRQYQHVTAKLEADASAAIGSALWPGLARRLPVGDLASE